jgi:hypothetical protein
LVSPPKFRVSSYPHVKERPPGQVDYDNLI